jgi:phosphatidylglycerophosphate synthase
MSALDFRLNRVFSAPLARVLLALPLTPNQVTSASLACGIAAGWLFSRGRYGTSLAAAALYVLAGVLDNCDGEIARRKGLGSVFGAWFDIGADLVVDAAVFIGIAASMLGIGDDKPVLAVLALCLFGAAAHAALVVLEKLRGFGPAAYGAANPDREGRRFFLFPLFDALREGDTAWLVLAFALAGKAHTLLWYGAAYLNLLWAAALAMNFRHVFRAR